MHHQFAVKSITIKTCHIIQINSHSQSYRMQTSAVMFQAIIQFITGDAIEQSAKTYVNGFISESFAMHLLTLPSKSSQCPFVLNMMKCFSLN